jgi:protoheme IX farnesyltransferase
MAPNVWGERETIDQMLWYTLILIPITVMPSLFGALGLFYGVSALVLGGILLWGVLRLRHAASWQKPAWWVYGYSLLYLALLFAAMVVDRRLFA